MQVTEEQKTKLNKVFFETVKCVTENETDETAFTLFRETEKQVCRINK